MSQETTPKTPGYRELLLRLEEVERRLAVIDRHLGIRRESDRPAEPAETQAERAAPHAGATEILPLIGRTFVVLGGAFVLRAVTESGLLHASAGAALGLLYALVWFFLADRAAGREAQRSAVWHGIAAVVIAYPLLWETTVEFAFLGSAEATAALSVITAAGLIVAWRRDLRGLGWIVTTAAVTTSLALAVGAKLIVYGAGFLLVLGAATLVLGYARGWRGPAWFVAIAANGTLGLLTVIALLADAERAGELFRQGQVMGLLLALVLVYVGGLFTRTWIADTDLSPAEIVAGFAATTIGLGGSIALVARTGSGSLALGSVALVLGFGAYAAAFRLVDRRRGRINFIVFSSLALIFSLIGAVEVMSPAVFAIGMAAGGVLMAWVGAWRERATLNLHGAVYAIAASLSSGLLAGAVAALAAPGVVERDWVSALSLATLAGVLGYCAFPVAEHGRTWGRVTTLPRLLVLFVAALGAQGTFVAAISAWFFGDVSEEVLPQAIAVLRTAVLALSSVGLAAIGRHPRMEQATWLVYPVLVAGGMKLLLEDLRVEKPAALVASFALYGAALIVAPRLARRRR